MIRDPRLWIGAATGLAVTLIAATILLAGATTAQARTGQWVTSTPTCGSYAVTLDLLSEPNQVDSRVIVTRDDTVVKTTDILGTINDLPGFYRDSGTLPQVGVNYKAWVFEEVDSAYVYSPHVGDAFSPNISIGDNGLHNYARTIVRGDNTCPTATAVPPTATSVPPTPTQTLPERCIAAGGIWTATGCQSVQPTPTATTAPVISQPSQVISPPNTGDAGLK